MIRMFWNKSIHNDLISSIQAIEAGIKCLRERVTAIEARCVEVRGDEKKGWCEEMIEAIKDDTEVALSRTDSLRYDYDLLLDYLGLKAEYVHAHRHIVKKAKK